MSVNQTLTSKISKLYTVTYFIYQGEGKPNLYVNRNYREKRQAVDDVEQLLGNILVTKIIVRDDFGHSKEFMPKELSTAELEARDFLVADKKMLFQFHSSKLELRPEIREWLQRKGKLIPKSVWRAVESYYEEHGTKPNPRDWDRKGKDYVRVATYLCRQWEKEHPYITRKKVYW